jgi:hypothetical protein
MIARRNAKAVRAILGTLVLTSTAALAGDFALDWWTVDGGGDMWTAGGEFELSVIIGQPDANTTVMAGGNFELTGGFWPAVEGFCFGDLDGDRDIDLTDLARLLGNYGETAGMTYEDGDLDGDEDVDLADLAALLAVYGTTCP